LPACRCANAGGNSALSAATNSRRFAVEALVSSALTADEHNAGREGVGPEPIIRLQRFAGRAFAVVAVNYGEGEPQIREFLKRLPVEFDMLIDIEQRTPEE
jgi:hypothetical protein